MSAEYVPPTYPVLNFIARSGIKVAVVLALALGACGLVAAYVTEFWLIAPVVIIVAVLFGGLLASYVELVRIVVDTLVPR